MGGSKHPPPYVGGYGCCSDSLQAGSREGSDQQEGHGTIRAAHGLDALEPKALVKRVGVLGAKVVADRLDTGMFEETLHDPFAQPPAPMIRMHDDIADPGEGGVIGDAANDPDLPSLMQKTQADGMADGLFDHGTRTVIRPVGGMKQSADDIQIEPLRIVREQVVALTPFARRLQRGIAA